MSMIFCGKHAMPGWKFRAGTSCARPPGSNRRRPIPWYCHRGMSARQIPRYLAAMNRNIASESSPPGDADATATGQLAAYELHTGDVLGGRFRIDALLGMGGMGIVYRARDLSLDIDVALKLLRPEFARKPEAFERFRQELLLARQVSSPHVVRIHDIAQHDGRWFISMDFVDGESLERRLDRDGRLETEDALRIAHHLFEGLAAAHGRKVVHRDLKPANILLDTAGNAYISDFGVARSLGNTGMTRTGLVAGTPEYLSPEQARGEVVDARSDLYTAGLILYEMLTGKPPYAGGTPAETMMQRLVRPPPLARARPDLPGWIGAFCDRLLRIRPAQRFASAAEALRALDARKVPRRPLSRRIWLSAALALVAAVALVTWLRIHPLHWPELTAARGPPGVAVLPFESDAALAPLARACEAHLRLWLRSAPALSVSTRTRTLAALARTAPDTHGDGLVRLMPDIAQAAGVDHLVRAQITALKNGYRVTLGLYAPDGDSPPQVFVADAASPAALPAAYRNTAGKLVAALAGKPPPEPVLPTNGEALMTFGRALAAMDAGKPAAAADLLAPLTKSASTPALVWLAALRAERDADRILSAQTTSSSALARFAKDHTLVADELRIAALAVNGNDSAALTARRQLAAVYPHDPEITLGLAEALANAGDGKGAVAAVDRRLAADPQDTHALFLRGEFAIQQDDAQRAVDDYLLRALVLDTRAGDAAAEAKVRNALGIGYERLGQLDDAMAQYEEAATVRERLGDREGLARTLRNLAIVQAEQGNKAGAENSLDRARAALVAIGDRTGLADLANDRGVVEEERGDFAAALAAYRDALAQRQQIGDPAPIAESLNNVGFCYYEMGDFDNALVYWQQALAAYRKLDDRPGTLHIEQSIGLLEIARGHFEAARAQLESTLRTAQDHQMPEEEAVAQTYLGKLDFAEGRYADALAAAARANDIFTRRTDLRGTIEADLLTARVAVAMGAASRAQAALAAIKPASAGTEQRAELALTGGRLALLDGDEAGAGARFADAAKLADAAHAGMLALDIRIAEANLTLARNDDRRAGALIAALHADTSHFGDVPLRLATIELELAEAVRTQRWKEAADRYREALVLLGRTGGWRDATLLHALGAEALTHTGAVDESDAARGAAAAARVALLAATPATYRAALQRQLDLRYQRDAGHG